MFDNSAVPERAQPPSINARRGRACFPLTKVHYISHENLISDRRGSQLLMPLICNRIGKWDAYLHRCTFIDLTSSSHPGFLESGRRKELKVIRAI